MIVHTSATVSSGLSGLNGVWGQMKCLANLSCVRSSRRGSSERGLSVIGAGTYSRARLIDPQIMYRVTMKPLAPEMELL